MNEQQLIRVIHSIGKMCFIKHFELLTNPFLSTKKIAETLMNLEGYSQNGAMTRANCAKRIFENSAIEKAIDLILKSQKIPDDIKEKAKKINLLF